MDAGFYFIFENMNWIKKQIGVFLFWFGITLFIHAWFNFNSIFIYQKIIMVLFIINLKKYNYEKN